MTSVFFPDTRWPNFAPHLTPGQAYGVNLSSGVLFRFRTSDESNGCTTVVRVMQMFQSFVSCGDPHSEAICARTVRLGEWCHFNSCIACSSHERLSGSSLQVTTYSQRAKDALEKSHPGAADAEVAQ